MFRDWVSGEGTNVLVTKRENGILSISRGCDGKETEVVRPSRGAAVGAGPVERV
jgi:hypothetical protein